MTSEKGLEHLKVLQEKLNGADLSKASESDTRAKLITATLIHVLGWTENDIKREEHTETGYMDYVLSTQRKALVVEAKKIGDTFSIPIESLARRKFKVGGIIRTAKNVKSHIDQVCSYCATAGIEYSAITNGTQWFVFRGSRVDGLPISEGILIVFDSLDDIANRFIEFWNLLSREAVFDGSLQRALHPSMATNQYRRLVDESHDRDDRVSRNSLGLVLTPLIGQYLQEIADDASHNLLLELYVKGRNLSDVFKTLEYRISIALSETIKRHNIADEDGNIAKIYADVERKVQGALTRKRGETVVLLGRVGSGKTTFVSHFLKVDLKKTFVNNMLVSIDYRDLEPGKDLRTFFYEQLRRALGKHEKFSKIAGENVRKVYAAEIRELTLGALAVLERTNKQRYEEKIADFLESQYTKNPDQYYVRVLRYAAEKIGIRCLIVFDNVDQLNSDVQQQLFAFAHSISMETHAISFLTMWEETYLRSRRAGSMSAYPTSGYVLPPISIVDVLRRRLEFIVSELRSGGPACDFVVDESQIPNIANFLELVHNSILHDKLRARYFLESIAMGNLRRAMSYFATFLTSGHTDAGKMLTVVKKQRNYLIPLHEFIKSIALEQ